MDPQCERLDRVGAGSSAGAEGGDLELARLFVDPERLAAYFGMSRSFKPVDARMG